MNPYRIMGRIRCATDYIMRAQSLQAANANASVKDLLAAMGMRFTGTWQTVCVQLYQAYCEQEQRLASGFHNSADERVGYLEGEYIISKYPGDWLNVMLSDQDFLPEMEEIRLKKQRRKRRMFKIGGCVLAVLVVGIIVYNLPYFKERRAYKEVIEAYETGYGGRWELDHYCAQFPDGKHLEELLYLDITHNNEEQNTIATLNAVDRYLAKFPNGTHADESKTLRDDAWNYEIDNYKHAIGDSISEGEQFVLNMLDYMRQHNVRTIAVSQHATLNLKEYSEYPLSVHQLMDFLYNGERFTPANSMSTIKDKITEDETNQWTESLISDMQQGFNKVFSYNFINVVAADAEDVNPQSPTVLLSYEVNTNEVDLFGARVPDLWTYTRTQGPDIAGITGITGGNVVGGGIYLGISMKYSADFAIPSTGQNYVVSGQGDPGTAEFKNVDPSTLYNRMCDRCISGFADEIAEAFGV